MDKEIYEKYLLAGEIADQVKKIIHGKVRIGSPILEICELVESEIKKLGGQPAFPCNVCVNDIAAHYTALPDDKTKIPKDSIVKVDIGVHIDGFIVDTAFTKYFSPSLKELSDIVRESLEKAVEVIREGVKVRSVSEAIEKTITGAGFTPIEDLSGHQLKKYNLHAGINIPNVAKIAPNYKLKEGEVYAIEPFATLNGIGKVIEGDLKPICCVLRTFTLCKLSPVEKFVLNNLHARFRTLPFAIRWIEASKAKLKILDKLARKRMVYCYPVLIEAKRGFVSQCETTVIVKKNGCEVLSEII